MKYNQDSKQKLLQYQKGLKQIVARMLPEDYEVISNYAKSCDMPMRQLILKSIEEYMINHPIDKQK